MLFAFVVVYLKFVLYSDSCSVIRNTVNEVKLFKMILHQFFFDVPVFRGYASFHRPLQQLYLVV